MSFPLDFSVIFRGFVLSATLIVAIGAQNAFVLRQGLTRRHVFATALVCAMSDAFLISVGVAGAGAFFASSPLLTTIATWGGAIFLFVYGLRSFWSALRPNSLEAAQGDGQPQTLRSTILAALAFSYLNPHVYLDTVVLLGSIGAGFSAAERPLFALGAMSASFVWFFGLAYGAAWLAPLFRRPIVWQILDGLIGLIMWAIAASLLIDFYAG
ncbi:MAG: amino acid transporter [Chloroflexi bacterium]|nr:MAG: amino acid transporter [Chloroflexota bacterium]MBL1195744.1 amino acid transporter [Chloroflexota bacterium]NOH13033.1 amino acid transporter [Chloroflexota bacterium]